MASTSHQRLSDPSFAQFAWGVRGVWTKVVLGWWENLENFWFLFVFLIWFKLHYIYIIYIYLDLTWFDLIWFCFDLIWLDYSHSMLCAYFIGFIDWFIDWLADWMAGWLDAWTMTKLWTVDISTHQLTACGRFFSAHGFAMDGHSVQLETLRRQFVWGEQHQRVARRHFSEWLKKGWRPNKNCGPIFLKSQQNCGPKKVPHCLAQEHGWNLCVSSSQIWGSFAGTGTVVSNGFSGEGDWARRCLTWDMGLMFLSARATDCLTLQLQIGIPDLTGWSFSCWSGCSQLTFSIEGYP